MVEDWLPHEEGHVEGEGGQEADVEEHDDHQVPLPRHPGPHQVLLQLKRQLISPRFIEVTFVIVTESSDCRLRFRMVLMKRDIGKIIHN